MHMLAASNPTSASDCGMTSSTGRTSRLRRFGWLRSRALIGPLSYRQYTIPCQGAYELPPRVPVLLVIESARASGGAVDSVHHVRPVRVVIGQNLWRAI